MASTDCFLAVGEHHASFSEVQKDVQHFGGDVAALSRILDYATKSTLVLAMCNHKDDERTLAKVLCTHFAETFVTPKGSYTQFTMSFVDEAAGDVMHCPCDRITDIDAVIDEEDGKHRCSSLRASTVEPTVGSFVFTDVCLTLLVWSEDAYGSDLAQVVDGVAAIIGTQFTSICVYFATGEIPEIDRYIQMAKELQEICKKRVFGTEKRISSTIRLQDLRAWSLLQNEFYHFSPQMEGPYFVNLNPQLAVGEKLAHAIYPGISYIVAEEGNASSVDIVVFPMKNGEADESHRSVYSPHCRISCDEGNVHLRPVCGMTYVNGTLLSSEILLQHNDRIILGQEMILRFVTVKEKPIQPTSSRILDWEMCCKEFNQVSKNTLVHALECRFEKELNQMKEEYEKLQRQLQFARRSEECMWIVLNNPPSDFDDSFVWELGWLKAGDSVTIGPNGDLNLPFLTNSAVISRTTRGLSYSSDGITVKLLHGSRFVMGDSVFSVSIQYAASKGTHRHDMDVVQEIELYSEDDIRHFRNSFFELQWTIAMLFDFVFPLGKPQEESEDSVDDAFYIRRKQLSSDAILTSKKLRMNNISRLTEKLTEAARMISSEMVSEMGCTRLPENHFNIEDKKEGCKEHLKELFDIISQKTKLSYDVLQGLHKAIGRALIDGDRQTGRNRNGSLEQSKMKDFADFDSCEGGVREKVMAIRAKFFIASQSVIRRMCSTVDALSMCPRPKELWEKYIKMLDTLLKTHSNIAAAPASKKQSIALALLDVLVAQDYAISRGCLSRSEEESIADRLPSWMTIAEHCVDCLKKLITSKRGGAGLNDAVLRKPTPNLRHASPGPSSLNPRKPVSRPGTARSANGRSLLNLIVKQASKYTSIRSESMKRVVSGVKSPRAARSSTPLGSALHGKSSSVARTSLGKTGLPPRTSTPSRLVDKGQRALSASPGVGGKAVPRLGANTAIHHTFGGTAPHPVTRSTTVSTNRTISYDNSAS